jgi:hypothetical protein
MRRPLLVISALALLEAACERVAEPASVGSRPVAASAAATRSDKPPVTGFSHEQGLDLAGYFIPNGDYGPGPWRLREVFVGSDAEFSQWEKDGGGELAPIFVTFEDTSSPKGSNELGGEYHEVSVRVFPTSYSVTSEEITFRGRDDKLGEVVVWGVPQMGPLNAAKAANMPTDGAALTGSVEVGGERIRNASFAWWRGD